MREQLNYFQASPKAMDTMLQMEEYITNCHQTKKSLDYKLIELVKMRVSQINGCAFCLDMHSQDTRAINESEQRLYTLSAWRETPFFTEKERAALAWAEAITLITNNVMNDQLFNDTQKHFDEEQIVDLTLVINAINAWNRFAISFGKKAGSYKRPTLTE